MAGKSNENGPTNACADMGNCESESGFYPYYFHGKVVAGFGRGGRQLGCPTANLDDQSIARLPRNFPCGIFYGLASIDCGEVYGMVTSIGWNPHFKNEQKTIEVHILHEFAEDFYGSELCAIALGFLRSMASYDTLNDLKIAIGKDMADAKKQLARAEYSSFREDAFFKQCRF